MQTLNIRIVKCQYDEITYFATARTIPDGLDGKTGIYEPGSGGRVETRDLKKIWNTSRKERKV